MLDLGDTLWQLVVVLGTLLVQVGALVAKNALVIVWIAWWLGAVNWKKTWAVLAAGGWMPAVLLCLIGALVWSRLSPGDYDFLGVVTIASFWWHLGAVTFLAGVALFCGWLQGVFHWAPPELNLEPPAPSGDAHGHHGHH